MRYWYDFSYEEIAEATNTTVSAVKSRLHRARGSLADMLAARAPAPHGAARSVPAGG
jgi:RNA polymerase sigma-70 factor (ECF subfamily)